MHADKLAEKPKSRKEGYHAIFTELPEVKS